VKDLGGIEELLRKFKMRVRIGSGKRVLEKCIEYLHLL
jgi:hypothetical protein